MGKFEIKDLYQLAFGYVAPPFPWGGVPDPANLIPLKSVLLGGRAQNRDAVRMATILKIPGFEYPLPNEPIISVTPAKEVVVTSLWGTGKNKGTVKEISDSADSIITISGLLVNLDADDLPSAEITSLLKIIRYNGVVGIDNERTRVMGITQGVIYGNIEMPVEAGEGIRYQRYTINMYSDQDFDLEINS